MRQCVNPEPTASPDASPNRCSLPGLAGLKARIVARGPGFTHDRSRGRGILLARGGGRGTPARYDPRSPNQEVSRRGARVVESAGLESRCSRKATVGSNPTLSASFRAVGPKTWREGGLRSFPSSLESPRRAGDRGLWPEDLARRRGFGSSLRLLSNLLARPAVRAFGPRAGERVGLSPSLCFDSSPCRRASVFPRPESLAGERSRAYRAL